MKLSDMALKSGEYLIRDAEFDFFGMVTACGDRLCVPANTTTLLDEALKNPGIAAIVCPKDEARRVPSHLGVIHAEDPLSLIFRNHIARFDRGEYWANAPTQIAGSAIIHPSSQIAETDVVIGENTCVGAGVVIERNSYIGADCILGPGVVIGGNGFEVRDVDGIRRTIPHGGGVKIGDRVEMQANTSVTRSLFTGATSIGDDTATDNLVHIAHNVTIGKRCRLAACAMIAGSTTLMDDVWIGPNATVSHGLLVGEGAQVTLGAVVIRDVASGEKVSGNFAINHRSFMRFFKSMVQEFSR